MKKLVLSTLLCMVGLFTNNTLHAQYINLFAGDSTGSSGYSGDGGQATAALLNQPFDIAFNSSGTLYIAEYGSGHIRKITPTGIISTVAGGSIGSYSGDGGAATAAGLYNPSGITVTSSGVIYFCDEGFHVIRKISTSGTITKVAGTPYFTGYTGDGGAATAARLNYPESIVADAAGNIYFADRGNYAIRKVNTSGIISTVAGNGSYGYTGDGGPATAATLSYPNSMCFDISGNLYFSDGGNSVIRKISTSGIITTVAGNGTAAPSPDGSLAATSSLYYPSGIIVDSAGNLFVNEYYYSGMIRKIDTHGILSTVGGNGSTGSFYFTRNRDLAINAPITGRQMKLDASGNLLIADLGFNEIRKINIGLVIGSADAAGICLGAPATFSAISFSSNTVPFYQWKINSANAGTDTTQFTTTNLVNGNLVSCQMKRGSSSGTVLGISDTIPMLVAATPGFTLGANPVACPSDTVAALTYTSLRGNPTNCYITWDAAATAQGFVDTGYGKIITTLAGGATAGYSGDGGPGSAAALSFPTGIATDTSGNLYIADRSNYVIRKVSASGIITTIAGTGTGGNTGDGGAATAANISPFSVMRDAAGNLYFTDLDNNVIRKINTSGIISKVAGTGSAGYSGDGSFATAAQINLPIGIVMSSTGIIYFSDVNNQRIRKISASGIITTIAGNGTAGFSGVGGPATAAMLNNPTGLALDASGHLYVAEYSNHAVRRITISTGIIDLFAGGSSWSYYGAYAGYGGDGGQAVNAIFNSPEAVTIDAIGNFYIADRINHVVRKIDQFGIITTWAGTFTAGFGPFYSGDGYAANAATMLAPIDVKTDNKGNIYIAEGDRVRKVNGFPPSPIKFKVPAAAAAGVYTGTITVSNSLCYDTTYSFSLTKNPLTAPGIISGGSTVCVGSNDTLTASIAGGTWGRRNTTASVTTGGIVTGTTAGIDTITYTVTTSCGTVTAIKPISINPLPAAGTISGPAIVCASASVTLSTSGSGGSWTALNTNASITSGGVVSGLVAGTDSITYTVTNGCGTATAVRIMTINPAPNAGSISGSPSVCTGTNITLTNSVTGGTWSAANSHATVNSAGLVSGITVGTDTIVYTVTNSCGTATTSKIIVVNPGSIAAISGPTTVCTGATITLTHSSSGGTWSTTNSNAFVTSGGGVVTGLIAGIDTIIYSVTSSCGTLSARQGITINTAPNAGSISGASTVCVGSGTTLTSVGSSAAGTWSNTTGHAAVTSAGLVGGITPGTDTIVYTVTNGCGSSAARMVMTINVGSGSGSVSGASSVCAGATTTLTSTLTGGSWSVTNSHAFVSGSGVVSGLSAGVDTIFYTASSSCGTATASTVITVNPAPNAGTISGASSVCVASTVTLTNTATGGAWSISNSHATVTTGGAVVGVTAGIDTVVYTATNSCGTATSMFAITINPLPNAGTISGATAVCAGATTTLTESATGGTWTVTNSHAFISSAGIVTGLTAGLDTIIYSATNSCGTATAPAFITVNPLPALATISGVSTICISVSATLTASVTGGTWSASNTHAVVTSSGAITGISTGIDTIMYTVTNGCGSTTASRIITVNPLPDAGAISGVPVVCVGATTSLSETATGGAWTASNSHASVSSTGLVSGVSAGVDTIMYTVTNSCGTAIATSIVTINPLPNPGTISGASTVCVSATTTLTNTATGGAWSATNSNATISSAGLVTGITAGTDTIIYTATNSCGTVTTTKIITVNPLPNAGTISGASTLCVGVSATLTESTTGGSWSATNGHASISSTGVVMALSAGVDTFVYTVTNSCGTATATATMTVNPLPNAGSISGASVVCATATITLTDGATGGAWTATNSHATVSSTGLVTGVTAGVDTIVYTVTNSCGTVTATKIVTVTPQPAVSVITGSSTVCSGASITLADTITGGTWSATNSHAVVSSAGLVFAVTTGIDTIRYTVTNSCGTVSTSKIVTINPLPNAGSITGSTTVCVGSSITLANTATGGTWLATNGNGTLAGSTLTGVLAGMDTVIYKDSNSCGVATASVVVSVNALPVPVITATGTVLSTTVGFLTYQWILNGTPIAGATDPTYNATENGAYTVTVTDANGCSGTSTGYNLALAVHNITPANLDIRVFPNPSESVVYIQSPVRVNVSVYAVDGRLALSVSDVKSIDMSTLASGAYMLVICDNETGTKLKTERIVKMGE